MQYIPLSKLYYSDTDHYDTIYLQRFSSESAYRFSFEIGKNPAFMLFTPELFSLLDEIMALDKQLSQLAERLPSVAIDQYTRKCLVDEILLTNDIEGVVSTRNEINETLEETLKPTSKQKRRFYGLMQKYFLLLEHDEIPLKSCQDVRNLYNEFILTEVKEEDPHNIPDGMYFRQGHVSVYSRGGKNIHDGLFPETKIITMMEQSLDFLNNTSYNALIRIAIFHYLFAYIHPFYDGNGRMTRFISSYMLSRKLHDLTGFRLSYTIKRNIDQYYKSFKITNDPKNKGDLTPFVISFFEILVRLIQELYQSVEKRSNQMDHYLELVKNHIPEENSTEINILNLLIINTLFGERGLSIQDLESITDLSASKLRAVIKVFRNDGILKINKDVRKHLYDVDLSKL